MFLYPSSEAISFISLLEFLALCDISSFSLFRSAGFMMVGMIMMIDFPALTQTLSRLRIKSTSDVNIQQHLGSVKSCL